MCIARHLGREAPSHLPGVLPAAQGGPSLLPECRLFPLPPVGCPAGVMAWPQGIPPQSARTMTVPPFQVHEVPCSLDLNTTLRSAWSWGPPCAVCPSGISEHSHRRPLLQCPALPIGTSQPHPGCLSSLDSQHPTWTSGEPSPLSCLGVPICKNRPLPSSGV